jgi:bifunctional DNA-binding transcriptional regulator/antitoxin component of YhaV-PrlF toxin-antitoxin module
MSARFKSIEFLATIKLGKKGQIAVPKRFREDLGIGALVDVLREGRGFERVCEKKLT